MDPEETVENVGEPTVEEEFQAGWDEAEQTDAEGEHSEELDAESVEEPAGKAGDPVPEPVAAAELEADVPEPHPEPAPRQRTAEEVEQLRRTQLGRINAHSKGLERMQKDFADQYGASPWEETPEQKEAREGREQQIAELDEKVPEVRTAIDDAVGRATQELREDISHRLDVREFEHRAQEHSAGIASLHPDYERYSEPEAGAAPTQEYQLLMQWMGGQPWEVREVLEAAYYGRDIEQGPNAGSYGSSDEVIALLSSFKEDLGAARERYTNKSPRKRSTRQAADFEAVPAGRSTSNPELNGVPDEEDFEGSYEYWKKQEELAERRGQ